MGFAAANNKGLRIAKGRYILLLNPDTLIHPQALEKLITAMDETPDAGACGPALCDSDGQKCFSVGYVPTFRSMLYAKTCFGRLGIFRQHYKKVTASKRHYSVRTPVHQISGAAIMVRRLVFDRIGLMDENFFLYFEDVDLCQRIRNAGCDIIHVPHALVTHAGGGATERISTTRQIYLYKSLFLYLRKHRGRLKTMLFAMIFKPAVLIGRIISLLEGFIHLATFTLLRKSHLQAQSITRIKRSAQFLAKNSWHLLFKA
jgi:GT2 family glycosyltransferase